MCQKFGFLNIRSSEEVQHFFRCEATVGVQHSCDTFLDEHLSNDPNVYTKSSVYLLTPIYYHRWGVTGYNFSAQVR